MVLAWSTPHSAPFVFSRALLTAFWIFTREFSPLHWARQFFEANTSVNVLRSDWPRVNRLLLEHAFPEEIECIANVRVAAIQQRFDASGSAALCPSCEGIRSATLALGCCSRSPVATC